MNCPICNDVRMRQVEKNEIQIDVCPDCKGVWLDRGELEKLMREVREDREDYNRWHQDNRKDDDNRRYEDNRQYDDNRRPPQQQQYDSYPKHSNDHHPYPKHRKKKNVMDMLGDLFD